MLWSGPWCLACFATQCQHLKTAGTRRSPGCCSDKPSSKLFLRSSPVYRLDNPSPRWGIWEHLLSRRSLRWWREGIARTPWTSSQDQVQLPCNSFWTRRWLEAVKAKWTSRSCRCWFLVGRLSDVRFFSDTKLLSRQSILRSRSKVTSCSWSQVKGTRTERLLWWGLVTTTTLRSSSTCCLEVLTLN